MVSDIVEVQISRRGVCLVNVFLTPEFSHCGSGETFFHDPGSDDDLQVSALSGRPTTANQRL